MKLCESYTIDLDVRLTERSCTRRYEKITNSLYSIILDDCQFYKKRYSTYPVNGIFNLQKSILQLIKLVRNCIKSFIAIVKRLFVKNKHFHKTYSKFTVKHCSV